MFYSETAQETLLDVCRKTLDMHGIQRDVTQALAANNQFSFNYTVWTLDSARQDQRINKMIVFGDSLSDTQNMFNASQWKLPNNSSWHMGRFSNGPVWAEYLANFLDLPMYNWAIGGSATDRYLVVPGLLQQVESWQEYMNRAPNYHPGNTLFTVLAGGNDLVNYRRPPLQAAKAVHDSLDKLVQSGAKHIVLVNLPDVSRAPIFSTRSDAARVAEEVKTFNHILTEAVAELRGRYGATLNIEIFDAYTLFNDLMMRPESYGFDDVTRSCLDIRNPSALSYIRSQTPRVDCRDPGRFVFWDTLHPSTRAHAWLAWKLAGHIRGFVKK
ncbi:SGNH/GDSL hydrolase family protein [Burkholderia ambifaria]|uniref:Lipolytic protein G-D-S-L family n=1 Tax=Burkholderia ambifaria MEX-5 TaxID=396597 RepID=B1TFN0_9BURK|nr:SGNH/GDSL hydrolase family protein [Burkholderia ambifaria]EDT37626.1 lipolytic protein G-D-S-L family [Burkholderia ambifaria MEX-5]